MASHSSEAQRCEERVIDSIKINHKYFFNYARQKSRLKGGAASLEVNGEEIIEGKPQQFLSVHSSPKLSAEDRDNSVEAAEEAGRMDQMTLTEDDLRISIKELPNSSAAGPDGIPVVLLKECAKELLKTLLIVWRESLKTSTIPKKLKMGVVIPISKTGDRHQPKNYRPISLTSHVITVFERVVAKEMVRYMEDNSLYNCYHHGFRRGHSCLSQLLEQYAEILNSLCKGVATDVIYLDISMAFNKLDHGILLRKFVHLGIE